MKQVKKSCPDMVCLIHATVEMLSYTMSYVVTF